MLPLLSTAGGSSWPPTRAAQPLPAKGCPTPHPAYPLCPQCRDWEDRLLHCHQHVLPAAAAGGCGGHPEDHLPAPSGQVSPWVEVEHMGSESPRAAGRETCVHEVRGRGAHKVWMTGK